jgi:hypothetical protein
VSYFQSLAKIYAAERAWLATVTDDDFLSPRFGNFLREQMSSCAKQTRRMTRIFASESQKAFEFMNFVANLPR